MKKIPSLTDQLKQSIKDVKAYKQEKLTFKSYKMKVPLEEFTPGEIKDIREKKLHVSQKILADSLGVSVRTLQGWEIGRSKPIGPANRLLKLLRDLPSVRKSLFAKAA